MNTRSVILIFVAMASPLALSPLANSQLDPLTVDRGFGVRHEGEIPRAIGRDFKATFREGSFRFTPALGVRAPRNFPVSLSLREIRRGNVSVSSFTRDVRPVTSGEFVTFRRSASILERYRVAGSGVELSFVFAERPEGRGDLTVRLELDTELPIPAAGSYDEGLDLVHPRFGGVHIGGVTGIDARGVTQRGRMRLRDGSLELSLRASFVDTASYPLVLDPLIGSQFPASPSDQDDDQPDVAYEATSDEYLVVWSRSFSQLDAEIFAQRIDGATHDLIGAPIPIATGAFDRNPAVATTVANREFVIAWETRDSWFGPADIGVRAVQAGSGIVSMPGVVGAAGNDIDPDVGGDRTPTARAALVWDDEAAGLRGARIWITSPSGPPAVLSSTLIVAGTDSTVGLPSVSKSGGDVERWMLVFETDAATDQVGGFVIDQNLGQHGPYFGLAASVLLSEGAPDCDGDGHDFYIAWHETENGLTGNRDVYCRRITADATTAMFVGSKVAVRTTPDDDQRNPTVSFLGPKVVVSWTDVNPGFLDTGIRFRALDPTTCLGCSPIQPLGSSGRRQENSKAASSYSGGGSSDEAMFVTAAYRLAIPFDSLIQAVEFEAVGAGGTVTSVAPECGGGGTCTIQGPFAFTASPIVELQGGDPSASVAVLHVGNVFSPVVPCGGCSLFTPFTSTPVPLIGGNASLQLNLECSVDLFNQQLRFQYLIANTSATPCLGLPVGVSNILEAEFGF